MPLSSSLPSRRTILKTAASTAALSCIPYTVTSGAESTLLPQSPNDRWRIGCIGMRYQGSVIAREALPFGDVVAICDVDRHVREQARASFGSTAQLYENYQDLLARNDIDVVLIGTPDHWHAKMLIEAVRAKKDVYCEKPLTLTIDEGKRICEVVESSNRVVQVGTWQRSDSRFRLAVEMVQAGRIGELKRIVVVMGKNQKGGPFASAPVPKHFNWNLWQGQTPDVPYVQERSHYTFRWWYEYSGGEMTDTGAHHLDIAQWGAGLQYSGPETIDGQATYPQSAGGYNVATDYHVKYQYSNGLELEVFDSPRGDYNRDGIMFEGTDGRIFVNRGNLTGRPVEDLATKPLARTDFHIYGNDNLNRPELSGKIDAIKNHMGNFYDCTLSRKKTISDVFGQHRSVSLCHLGNISMRLGRPLKWDAVKEVFIDDAEANTHLRRDQRAGFEMG